MSDKQKALMIRIASVLSWVFGALSFVVLAAILIPAVSKGQAASLLAFFIVLAVLTALYCVIGWGLGKSLRWPAILALVISGLNVIFNILAIPANPSAVIGVILGAAMIILIVLGWKTLK